MYNPFTIPYISPCEFTTHVHLIHTSPCESTILLHPTYSTYVQFSTWPEASSSPFIRSFSLLRSWRSPSVPSVLALRPAGALAAGRMPGPARPHNCPGPPTDVISYSTYCMYSTSGFRASTAVLPVLPLPSPHPRPRALPSPTMTTIRLEYSTTNNTARSLRPSCLSRFLAPRCDTRPFRGLHSGGSCTS